MTAIFYFENSGAVSILRRNPDYMNSNYSKRDGAYGYRSKSDKSTTLITLPYQHITIVSSTKVFLPFPLVRIMLPTYWFALRYHLFTFFLFMPVNIFMITEKI